MFEGYVFERNYKKLINQMKIRYDVEIYYNTVKVTVTITCVKLKVTSRDDSKWAILDSCRNQRLHSDDIFDKNVWK